MKVAGVRLGTACYLAVVCVNMQWVAGLNSTLLTNKCRKQDFIASWWYICLVSVKGRDTICSVLLSPVCFSGIRLQLEICLPLSTKLDLNLCAAYKHHVCCINSMAELLLELFNQHLSQSVVCDNVWKFNLGNIQGNLGHSYPISISTLIR